MSQLFELIWLKISINVKVFLLQLFWLSFCVIGYGEARIYRSLQAKKSSKPGSLLAGSHWLTKALLAFVLGMASFAPLVVLGILWQWSIFIVEAVYILLLLLSCTVVIVHRKDFFRRPELKKPAHIDGLLASVAFIIVVAAFLSLLLRGGMVGGDAKFEIAQINLFAQSHLTLADPVLGVNGVPATVYSFSIQHTLQAVAVNILHMPAARVWFYSWAFFELIIWVSLFTLLWELLDTKVRSTWAYCTLILLVLSGSQPLTNASYHNVIVFAWECVLLLGIKQWLEARKYLALYLGAFLIASAHPLNSLMAASFLGLFLVALALIKRLPKKNEVFKLMPIFVVLLAPIALYFYYPHGITKAGFNDGPLIGPTLHLYKIGPIFFSSISYRLPMFVVPVALFVWLTIWAVKHSQVSLLRKVAPYLTLIPLLLVFPPAILSLIGFFYLFTRARPKELKILIILLVVFDVLIFYNPLILTLSHGRIPLWALSRFQGFNTLAFVASTIGLLYVCMLPFHNLKQGGTHLTARLSLAVIPLSLVLLPVLHPEAPSLSTFAFESAASNRNNLRDYQVLNSLSPAMRGQIIFSDDPDLPARIPAAVVTNVFSIDNEANANPAVHIAQRKVCAQKLRQSFTYNDVEAAGITAVVTSPNSSNHFKNMLKQQKFISWQAGSHGYNVYKVLPLAHYAAPVSSVCNIPPTVSRPLL